MCQDQFHAFLNANFVFSLSKFCNDSNNPHQGTHPLATNQLNVAGSVTASAPLLTMGGEHSAFRSLVPSASAAALLAASAQLGLTRSYNHSPHMMSDASDEEINVHDDESDNDSNYNPRRKTTSSNNNNEMVSNKISVTSGEN